MRESLAVAGGHHGSDPVGYRSILGDPGTPGNECLRPHKGWPRRGGDRWVLRPWLKDERSRSPDVCELHWRRLLAERTQGLGQHSFGSLDLGVELGSALASLRDLSDARTVGEFVGFAELSAQLL